LKTLTKETTLPLGPDNLIFQSWKPLYRRDREYLIKREPGDSCQAL